MQTQLAQLHDVHLPPPVSAWPLAPGWYGVFIINIILFAYIAYKLYKKWQAYRLRRECLQSIKQLTQLSEVGTQLRRIVMAYYPREDVAGLWGDTWLNFLDSTGKTTEFSQGIGRALIKETYQDNHNHINLDKLCELIEAWIRRQTHHV